MSFDFDKDEKIKQQLHKDVDLVNRHQIVSKRLDYYQAAKRCCGIYSKSDYLATKPDSCMNRTKDANIIFAIHELYADENLKMKAKIANTNYNDQIIITNDGQLQFLNQSTRKFKEVGLDKYGNILSIKDEQIIDDNVKIVDDQVEYQRDYHDFLEEYFYKDGCLGRLYHTHSYQKQLTNKLLYNVILTSFISIVITYVYYAFGKQKFSNVTKTPISNHQSNLKYHLV